MKAVVSEKGQVTIPKAIRDRLGIRPGQALDFVDEGGRIVVAKADETDAVERFYGILPSDESTDAFIRSIRGDPDAT